MASLRRCVSAEARIHRQTNVGIRRISSADKSHYPLNRGVLPSTFCLISVHKPLKIRRIMILEGTGMTDPPACVNDYLEGTISSGTGSKVVTQGDPC